MFRFGAGALTVLLGVPLLLFAQGGDIQNARIKKVNIDDKTITLTVGGKDRDFLVTEQTKLPDAPGKSVKERLQFFKEGAEVVFKAARQDDKDILVGMKLAGTSPAQPKVDTSHLKPLGELGTGMYQGFKGGFYRDGKNERPPAHEAAGLALAKEVRPLDASGKPSDDGKIVLLSVGMSNTAQASNGFEKALARDKEKNPRLLFVNGAQGGMTAVLIQNPDKGKGADYWARVDDLLKAAGVTRAQVQVIWIKEADAGPKEGFPQYAKKLQAELAKVVQLLPARFPNLKLVYLSSRTYGGFATTQLNPEPYAYESGFSVKWLIEQQIQGDPDLNYDPKKGPVKAPWLSWGAYLWANGTTKRADGFSYEPTDFTPKDGTHLSPSGIDKVGRLLLEFFKTDATTRPWFVGKPPKP
jgi:hypothetical protein